jgi:hypothetical protein
MSLPGQTPEEVEALVPPALPARKGKVKLVQRAGGGDGPGGVGAKALAGVVPPGKKASDAFTVHRLASLAHMLDTYVALSKTQMEFKKKLLGDHGTSWAHQHYHVFERWTRAHVMVTTAVLGLLGLLQLSLMFIWLDKQKISASNPFQAGLIGYGYMLIAPLCIVTAAIGGYGAHKIKQDLQKQCDYWAYFAQISEATTSYGGYSGAPPSEKISWGKLEPNTPNFMIESDATVCFPLLASYVLGL